MLKRSFFWIIGAISLALGILGAFLPVLPTVPFILLSAACWAKASPRFHQWLVHHRYFGPMIRDWEENRTIPRRAKILASVTMSLSCISLFIIMPERWWVAAASCLLCIIGATVMWRFPDTVR